MKEWLPIPVVVVLAAALPAAATDIWKFKVYNVLTFPLILFGLLYHAVAGGTIALAWSLLGVLVGIGVLIPLYMLGAMGAGDVKFMAGLGAWLGAPTTLLVFLLGCIATGIYALVLVFWNRQNDATGGVWVSLHLAWHRLAAVARNLVAEDSVEVELQRDDRRRRLIPFTAMVAVGLVAALAWFSWW